MRDNLRNMSGNLTWYVHDAVPISVQKHARMDIQTANPHWNTDFYKMGIAV